MMHHVRRFTLLACIQCRRRWPFFFILVLMVAFAIFFSVLAVRQHRTFQTNGLDLGNVDQALWNTAQGHFFQFTLMTPVRSRLALHVEPILLLFVPVYWLELGGPELLLVVQASVVALGAWPLYQLAMSNLQISRSTPNHASIFNLQSANLLVLALPLAYLLLPTLESAVLFDFHAVTFTSTFLLFAFWGLVTKRDGWFFFFSLLTMACKEDMPLVVGMLGLYAGMAQRRWRLAGLTLGLSAAWFALAVLLIQPRFAGGNIQLDRYAWLGDNPLAMVQTVITQPGLVFNHLWFQADLPGYLIALMFPTAFLALFSPLTLLPMLPTLAVNLLSDNPFTWRLEDFHYGAPLAPFLFISTIYGIRRIDVWVNGPRGLANHSPPPPRSQTPWLIVSLTILLFLFTAVYHYHRGFTPLARPFNWPGVTAHHRLVADLIPAVRPDTALFAQSNLAPHLSQRRVIYGDFGYFTDPNFPAPVPVEEIMLDITAFENMGGLHQFLRQSLLENRAFQFVATQDGVLHLKGRDDGSQTTYTSGRVSTSFYTFARPTIPPDYPLRVDFGDAVRLHGFSLHFNRQEEIEASVDLKPLRPLAADIQPVLYLLDANGQPIGATIDLQPTLVWYPPNQWPVGQTVRVRFNTLPWYTRQTPAYQLGLGLVSGEEVWAVEPRFRPVVDPATPLAVRLPAGETLIELARIKQVWDIPSGGPQFRQFRAPRPPFPIRANFDNRIMLLGHTLPQIEREDDPSEFLSLTLQWQALGPLPDLVRFVQLVGPDAKLYGQQDSAPDDGAYPTRLWQPGEVVNEVVTFPVQSGRPAGDYTLHIGLYHADTGRRLPLSSGGDHVEIEGPFSNVK